MDKGWGLTLDSIAINSFLNKRSRGILESGPMLDMPVGDERREVDFFAEKTRSVSVKKENSHVDEAAITDLDVNVIKNAYIPTELSSLFFFFCQNCWLIYGVLPFLPCFWQTGLNLLTANAGSDQSTVEDENPDRENKRAKIEVRGEEEKAIILNLIWFYSVFVNFGGFWFRWRNCKWSLNVWMPRTKSCEGCWTRWPTTTALFRCISSHLCSSRASRTVEPKASKNMG